MLTIRFLYISFAKKSAVTVQLVFLLISGSLASLNGQQFPATRNVYKWPFEQRSIWNTSIGSDAEYVFAGIKPAKVFKSDEALIFLDSEAPMTDIYRNTAAWSDVKRCDAVTDQIIGRVPIPADFNTEGLYIGSKPNHPAVFLMPDKRTIRETQPFHRCGSVGRATSGFFAKEDIDLYGDGRFGCRGGSRMSSMGGTIRMGELLPGGVIRHVLSICLWAQNLYPGYKWPAYKSYKEGLQKGTNPDVQPGSLFALRRDFPLNSLVTEPARIVAHALMNYGAYTVDDTAWSAFYLNTEWGTEGRVIDEFKKVWGFDYNTSTDGSTDWGKDMMKIFTSLCVIKNNSPESKGGGGIPCQPPAPPFDSEPSN
jgi:hypothetical protein